ncbi:hypothetical protein BU16DRAFT_371136 [Lophium mytilinum]|uniref:Uncharacterized protein n=1 Tax=Lophium mytilinum TaxID=390894 RepID=A0A6A6QWK2_9PEZI|nr:hypothetical protein BU16DRAFT_371136 [Lophium mytilinum]
MSLAHEPGFCHLLRLPNELLIEILTLAVDYQASQFCDWQGTSWYKTPWSLTLVCRRISLLAYPLLYHTISFQSCTLQSLVPISKPAKLLLRTLCANPTLGPLCKEVKVNIKTNSQNETLRDAEFIALAADFDAASIILGKLPNVQTINSCGGFSHRKNVYPFPMWEMLSQAFNSMPLVSNLTLTLAPRRRQWNGLMYLDDLIELDFPALKHLHLDGVSSFCIHSIRGVGILPEALRGKRRTAPFTKLSMRNFRDTSSVLSALLTWARALEHFVWETSRYTSERSRTCRMVHRALEPHYLSLKSFKLDNIIFNDNIIDLTQYVELQDLHLSAFVPLETIGNHALHLAAPKLRSFTWDLTRTNVYPEPFNKSIVDGLRTFVDVILSQGCPLQRIDIIFWPRPEFYTETRCLYSTRPTSDTGLLSCSTEDWDCMHQLASELELLGVALTYDKPRLVTKEEYEGTVKEWEPFGKVWQPGRLP